MLRRMAFAALVIVLAAGCAKLTFIKRRLPPPHRVEGGVLFQFDALSARIVQLCGSWQENNWCQGQAATGSYLVGLMRDNNRDGIWEIVVDLPPGRYQYKFRIDEQNWKEDPNNPQKTDDGFGGFNSIAIVD